jgi:hypothetical protein
MRRSGKEARPPDANAAVESSGGSAVIGCEPRTTGHLDLEPVAT